MIQAIAFDLDDTLFPEEDFVYSGYLAVSEAVNKDFGLHIYGDLVALFRAGKHAQAFELALRGHLESVPESYLRSLVQVYRGHEPELHLFPEVATVLRELRMQYRLGLISDGYETVQERKLHALDIRHNFEVIVFSDQWGSKFWKPHARPFLECARMFDLDPVSMVYVGDNPAKDVVTARKMGMVTVRVRRPGTLHYLMQPGSGFAPDHDISSLDELIPLLCAMGRGLTTFTG